MPDVPDWKQEIIRRLGSLRLAPAREAEIVEELSQHLEDRYQELLAGGMAEAEARRVALAELSDDNLLARGLRRVDQEAPQEPIVLGSGGGHNFLASVWQDIRYGLRQLRRNPGFTAIAVVTLALGIGANTAIFSAVDAVLVRPLPFPQPGRIVQLLKQYKSGTGSDISVPLFDYWKVHNQVFSHFAAFSFQPIGFNLATRGLPDRVAGARVSQEFFKVLGVDPILGRDFLAEEDRPGGRRVVVLGYSLWRTRFGGNRDLVGEAITLDDQPYTVIGIMPPGFRFPASSDFGTRTDLWTPLQLPPASRDPANYLDVIGRLRPDVTRAQAAARMSVLTQQLRKEFSGTFVDMGERAALVPLHERLVGNLRPALLVLMAAAGLVLLIACVNITNLMLSRTSIRGKEMGIRRALGAGRARMFIQLTVESVLLALGGGTLGLLVALAGDHLLVALNPIGLPQLSEAGLDWRVLVFTLGVSILTGSLFGLTPALNASNIDLHQSLKESSLRTTTGGQHRRLSGILVVGEIALSLMLLAGAGLLLGSFVKLAQVNPGFDPRHVLTFETTLPESKYGMPSELSTFYREVLECLQSLPGVEAAGTITNLPTEIGPNFPFSIEGRAESTANQDAGISQYRVVSPDYFRVMRIPLLRGRFFTDADTEKSAGVVIINETMARQYWPHQSPVGQTLTIAKTMGPEWTDRPRQIVGVVSDIKDISLDEPAPAEMFVPYTEVPAHMTALMVRLIPTRWVLRTRGDPHLMTALAAHAVASVDANEAIANARSMEDVLSSSISRWRFNMLLVGMFSALALILGAVGIYGVLSYLVTQRTHEIGIRVALGAQKSEVLKMVVGQGLKLTLIGVGIGVVAALGLTRFLSSLLYGVKPTDPLTFIAVALILTAVALLACYIPARRATKVDPMVALRYE